MELEEVAESEYLLNVYLGLNSKDIKDQCESTILQIRLLKSDNYRINYFKNPKTNRYYFRAEKKEYGFRLK